MAAPFARLAANGAKRVCLRPQSRIATAARTQYRALSSTPARRFAEPIDNPNATRLIPVDPSFGSPVDPNSMLFNAPNDKPIPRRSARSDITPSTSVPSTLPLTVCCV